eukprot:682097_1
MNTDPTLEFIPGDKSDGRYLCYDQNKFRQNRRPFVKNDGTVSHYWICKTEKCEARLITTDLKSLSSNCTVPRHTNHPNGRDNYDDEERLKEWSANKMVQLANLLDGKVKAAWNEFKMLFPIQSLLFSDFEEVESYVRRHKNQTYPKLPTSVSDAYTTAKETKFGTFAWDQSVLELIDTNVMKETKEQIKQLQNNADALQKWMEKVDSEMIERQAIRRAISAALLECGGEHGGFDAFQDAIILGRTDDEANIIFGDKNSLKRLRDCKTWCIDGTFPKVSISSNADKQIPWKQVLQIHVLLKSPDLKRRSQSNPCLFVLTKDKKESTYVDILRKLKEIAASPPFKINLSPKK